MRLGLSHLVMYLNGLQEFSLTDFPIQLNLTEQAVHIWRSPLDLPNNWLHQFASTLSPDEQARANRFRFERDRQWFIAGRGILRLLLSSYLTINPEQLQFTYSVHGKPALNIPDRQQQMQSGIAFNVSHSQGLALYSITCDRPIGIDVEQIRFIQDMEQLAERFFLPSESALIQSVPVAQRQHLFFRLWTYKEAYLKATGEGITGLKRVEILLNPDSSIAALNINNAPASHWTMLPLDLEPHYAAALAVAGENLQFTQYALINPNT